jgi:putative peptidoglycan lipid II flippase
VFIPNYIAELKTGKNIAAFQATGFLITGSISLLFVLIAYLFTDTYLEVFFSGHTEEYYAMVKSQFNYLAPGIFIWGISSLLGGLLNINKEFKYSSYPGVFIPLVIIISLTFFKEELGNNVLAIGTLLGSLLALLFLLSVCIRKQILSISYPNFTERNVQLMFKQIPAKVSSGFLSGMNTIVDQFFAAQLVIGSVAAINYGLKMPAFLMGIMVIALTNVLLPQFSAMLIENKKNAYRVFFKIVKFLFLSATVCAVFGIFLSDFLVELFFQRKEFTAGDTEVVANIQKIFLVYTPFAICGMVVVSFLTSMNKNAIMAYVSLGAVIANIILDYILIRYFGILGIALCTTIVVIIKNLFLFYFTLKIIKSNPG